jgi:nicotinamidase-related amidase
MTLSQLGENLVELLPELAGLCPPAAVFDKQTYSPWADGRLHAGLRQSDCHTLVVTGGETDVCVLATVLGAIVVADALCSSADETHDAVMTVYSYRYGQQIEVVSADMLMDEWRPVLR